LNFESAEVRRLRCVAKRCQEDATGGSYYRVFLLEGPVAPSSRHFRRTSPGAPQRRTSLAQLSGAPPSAAPLDPITQGGTNRTKDCRSKLYSRAYNFYHLGRLGPAEVRRTLPGAPLHLGGMGPAEVHCTSPGAPLEAPKVRSMMIRGCSRWFVLSRDFTRGASGTIISSSWNERTSAGAPQPAPGPIAQGGTTQSPNSTCQLGRLGGATV
jgi:hypothetical protein